MQSLRTRLADLQRQKVQLNERYGPKNPQVIENENAIADTTKQYQEALRRGRAAIRNDYETTLAPGTPSRRGPRSSRKARRWT